MISSTTRHRLRSARHAAIAGTALLGSLALSPPVPAYAAPPPTVNSAALSEELERLADTTAGFDAVTYDDSTSTACRGTVAADRLTAAAAPDPLVYSTNRIVLRTTKGEAGVRRAVSSALGHIGRGDVEIGPIERITLPPKGEQWIKPVVSVTLLTAVPVDVVALARDLRAPHHAEIAAPDYVYSPTGGPTQWWPDGFPEPIPVASLTPPRAGAPGSGVTIAVYDSGMVPPSQSNNPPNLSRLTLGDRETLDADGDGIADAYYSGHLTAIAGTLNVIAPGATVKAIRITDQTTGVATDVSSARRMATTLRSTPPASWPRLIVTAFGSQACLLNPSDPTTEMEPLGLQAVAEAVDLHDVSLIVASAGNRGNDQRFYPAAFSTARPSAVISVGALDTTQDADGNPWTSLSRTGPRAPFSNYGKWVTAWSSGVKLPTHHILGLRFEPDPAPVIGGAALVSGSSFSGPALAGLIAEQMARTGADADTAWAAIRGSGVRCSQANGSGVAVALTTMASLPVTPPGAPRQATDC